jgi:hypothetical protein
VIALEVLMGHLLRWGHGVVLQRTARVRLLTDYDEAPHLAENPFAISDEEHIFVERVDCGLSFSLLCSWCISEQLRVHHQEYLQCH